jgi:small subunit ribosomal protein S8
MTDPIADMLTRIRNAAAVGGATVEMPHSQLKQSIADLLVREGWLEDAVVHGKKTKRILELSLKFANGVSAISGLRRISKPGKRVYAEWKMLRPVKNGFGAAVISTSKGLYTNKEARKTKTGGEIMFEIW